MHAESYADAQRAIDSCRKASSFKTAKPAIVDKVLLLEQRIWKDSRGSAIRRQGRSETAAIAHELHRIAERKKLTDYTHLLGDDIWISIAQFAGEMDDRSILRMSHVNRRMRGAIANTPGLWNRLSLGSHRKSEAKMQTYLDRCTGGERAGLLRVTIKPGCDRLEAFPSMQDKMRDHLGNVREFTLDLERLNHQLTVWRHKLEKVVKLDLGSVAQVTSSDMTFGLVPPTSSKLRELSLTGISLQQSIDLQDRYQADRAAGRLVPPLTIPDAAVQLANLRKFTFASGHLGQRLHEYLHAMPKLEILHFSDMHGHPGLPSPPAVARPALMEHLHTVELLRGLPETGVFFHDITAPNLQTLEMVMLPYVHFHNNTGSMAVAAQLSAPGLAPALSNLTSLELFQSMTNTQQLMPLLEKMSSLRYLGLALTGVTNDLVQALVTGKKDAQGNRSEILPKLEALSIAGMADLNAADLRDLVCARKGLPLRNGRLVYGSMPPSLGNSQSASQVPKKKGLFGATKAPGKTASQPRPPSATPSVHATPSVPASAPPAIHGDDKPAPLCAPLRWLNLDHCHTLDYTIVGWLSDQIGFVSANMGHDGGVQDRMMGKNQWSWDLNREVCDRARTEGPALGEDGYVGPCGVVEDKGEFDLFCKKISHGCVNPIVSTS